MSARPERMSFAATKDEHRQITTNATYFGLTVSEFLRHVALGGTIDWNDPALKGKAKARRAEVAS